MEFVEIPAGEFTMGSNNSQSDKKRPHRVTISEPFYLGVYLVTQWQWWMVMENSPSDFQGDNRPVESVSWDDIQEFIKKLNEMDKQNHYRLPTEAEWEYACRAGSADEYFFGNDPAALGLFAWYSENSGDETHAVGEKAPNPWGLYDMLGNVWEWCQDWYDDGYYRRCAEQSTVADPTGPDRGNIRAFRGGGYRVSGRYCRPAFRRGWRGPSGRDGGVGFRLVLRQGPSPQQP